MKTVTLEELNDKFFGPIGTPERDRMEAQLKEEIDTLNTPQDIKVLIERASDGSYSCYMQDVDQLPYGLNGVGFSPQEAIDDWNACYEEMRQYFESEGQPFTEGTFTFAFDLPSFLRYYAGILSFAGLARLTGVSAAQLSQYASGFRNPSPKTVEKISAAIHEFGRELTEVQFS